MRLDSKDLEYAGKTKPSSPAASLEQQKQEKQLKDDRLEGSLSMHRGSRPA